MKKCLSLVLALFLLIGMIPAGALAADKPVHLTWMTTGDSGAEPLLENDRIVAKINELLNIDLEVIVVPEGDASKVNVAVASNDPIDVITTSWPTATVNSWIEDGVVVPITPYLDDTTPTLKAALENDFSWTAVDGEFYGYPFISQYSVSNQAMMFRQDWMEKLGLEVPTTLDELYNVLYAFTYNDPDGNGENDTYGMSHFKNGNWFFDWVFYAYGRDYADYCLDAEGNVIPVFEDPSFIPGMEYLRKLWNDGLIDPEFYMNNQTRMEEKFYQSKVGYITCYLYRHVSRIEGNLQALYPEGKLGYSLAPKGPEGDIGYKGRSKAGSMTFVSYHCKEPAVATRFIDFMISPEGRDLLMLGIEGVHYTKDGDTIIFNEEERAKDNFSPNGWCHPLTWGSFAWPVDSIYLPATEPAYERAIESCEIASTMLMPNLVGLTPNSQTEYGSVLDDLYQTSFIEMLTGKVSVEEGVKTLSEKWRAQGGETILAEVTEMYQQQK